MNIIRKVRKLITYAGNRLYTDTGHLFQKSNTDVYHKSSNDDDISKNYIAFLETHSVKKFTRLMVTYYLTN